MGNPLLYFSSRLFFSRRHRSLRGSIVFITANLLMLASIIFFVEIIVIFLGLGNFYIPFTHGFSELLSKIVFR